MAFTKQQPKHGDTIMHCGHVGTGPRHWFQYAGPMRFTRPDRTCGEAAWFTACEPCFVEHGAGVTDYVRGDAVWTGHGPTIEKEEN